MPTTTGGDWATCTMAYLHYCDGCGKVKACGVGIPGEHDGHTERVTVAEMRANANWCRCKPKDKQSRITRDQR